MNIVVLINTKFSISSNHEQPCCFINAQRYYWNKYIFLTLEFTFLQKTIYVLTTSVNAKYYLLYTLILHRHYHLHIYRTRTQAHGNGFCSSIGRALVLRSRVAGSIPSRRPWSCIFRNWSQLGLKMYIFLTFWHKDGQYRWYNKAWVWDWENCIWHPCRFFFSFLYSLSARRACSQAEFMV